jgi:hypothetical protein
MDLAPVDVAALPWRIDITLEYDPGTGTWGYSSDLNLPTGRWGRLSGWETIRWRKATAMLRKCFLNDVSVVETWADYLRREAQDA